MSSSSSSSNNSVVLVLTFAFAMGTTAAATYFWTSQREQQKYLKEKKENYERELMIKEKTVQARILAHEKPASGTLVADVSIQRVYLWEVEDLKKRFQPSKQINIMHNVVDTNVNYFFPTLKVTSSMNEDDEDSGKKVHETNYNKLITNHECILANLVRKPNQETFTHAYVRAGPRKYLHFDPTHVSAAIVTCGGLCPGLNNVIREIVKVRREKKSQEERRTDESMNE